uniref:Secreted protein n=1 Tax=Meloidogyne hapla TaxID=6305 RepID=A0A1I8BXY9_MELHA
MFIVGVVIILIITASFDVNVLGRRSHQPALPHPLSCEASKNFFISILVSEHLLRYLLLLNRFEIIKKIQRENEENQRRVEEHLPQDVQVNQVQGANQHNIEENHPLLSRNIVENIVGNLHLHRHERNEAPGLGQSK